MMKSVNTEPALPDIPPELLAQYALAVRFVNLTAKCKEYGVTRDYVYRVLRGNRVTIAKMAKAVQVLADSLSEFNAARLVITNTIQRTSNAQAI